MWQASRPWAITRTRRVRRCAAALATLDCLELDGLLQRADQIGSRAASASIACVACAPDSRDPLHRRAHRRRTGPRDGQAARDAAERVMYAASPRLELQGRSRQCAEPFTALIISDQQLDTALDILEHALLSVVA